MFTAPCSIMAGYKILQGLDLFFEVSLLVCMDVFAVINGFKCE